MEALVLNEQFVSVIPVDTYESFIWVDRYNEYGDFELYAPIGVESLELLNNAKIDYYLWTEDSDHVMIIDEITITSDIEAGNRLKISGRSLEWILNYRIVWTMTTLTGNFQTAIQKLLNDALINPTINTARRKINNFIFKPSTDPRITAMTIDMQVTGDNLYDTIRGMCRLKNVGFRVTLNNSNQFVFELYKGVDRSYAQTVNPYVVFSQGFDNIINSNYFETNRIKRTVALVAGEGEGPDRRTITVDKGGVGLKSRELYADARDISSKTDDPNVDLTPQEYNAKLTERGNKKLSENVYIKSFEGDMETTQMYRYKEHFWIGDDVQMTNEFGIEAGVRIDEIIFSNNQTGSNVVPTFTVIE